MYVAFYLTTWRKCLYYSWFWHRKWLVMSFSAQSQLCCMFALISSTPLTRGLPPRTHQSLVLRHYLRQKTKLPIPPRRARYQPLSTTRRAPTVYDSRRASTLSLFVWIQNYPLSGHCADSRWCPHLTEKSIYLCSPSLAVETRLSCVFRARHYWFARFLWSIRRLSFSILHLFDGRRQLHKQWGIRRSRAGRQPL